MCVHESTSCGQVCPSCMHIDFVSKINVSSRENLALKQLQINTQHISVTKKTLPPTFNVRVGHRFMGVPLKNKCVDTALLHGNH